MKTLTMWMALSPALLFGTTVWADGLPDQDPYAWMNDMSRWDPWCYASCNGTTFTDFNLGMRVDDGKDAVTVTADVPGIDPKDITVTLKDDQLDIRGRRMTETSTETDHGVTRQRQSGSFERSMTLPAHVDGERMAIKIAKGVLTVTVPKVSAPAKESTAHRVLDRVKSLFGGGSNGLKVERERNAPPVL